MSNSEYCIPNEKILVFEPHPDDVAYNFMGTVIKWLEEDKDLTICTVTKGNNSTFKPTKTMQEIQETMRKEHQKVHDMLNLDQSKVVQWDYDDLGMDPAADRRGLLRKMINLIREIKPTTVITIDPKNLENEENPDHRIVAMTGFESAAMAAYPNVFREDWEENGLEPHFVSRMLFYMTPEPNVFVDISGK